MPLQCSGCQQKVCVHMISSFKNDMWASVGSIAPQQKVHCIMDSPGKNYRRHEGFKQIIVLQVHAMSKQCLVIQVESMNHHNIDLS